MNCFQLVRSVLDEIYQEILAEHGKDTDELIRQEILKLSSKYKDLLVKNELSYENPITRFAYIYAYTTAHADAVYTFIQDFEALKEIFDADVVNVSCIGGGPGSDFLGILKFITLPPPKPVKKLSCLLCDREQSWREAWVDVDQKVDAAFRLSTVFWELDVTDPETWASTSKLFHADLFTMIYFMSELYESREDARDFFETMVDRAKSGAIFLLIDNNTQAFFTQFDEIAQDRGLDHVSGGGDLEYTLGWEEQADALDLYNKKFNRSPKIQFRIAYRIYRKP